MKKALLVEASLKTRVIVPEEFDLENDFEKIVDASQVKFLGLIRSRSELGENVTEIEEDLECPYDIDCDMHHQSMSIATELEVIAKDIDRVMGQLSATHGPRLASTVTEARDNLMDLAEMLATTNRAERLVNLKMGTVAWIGDVKRLALKTLEDSKTSLVVMDDYKVYFFEKHQGRLTCQLHEIYTEVRGDSISDAKSLLNRLSKQFNDQGDPASSRRIDKAIAQIFEVRDEYR